MADLIRQAEKKLTGFMSMFNSSRFEEAQELYQKAGARFKAEKNWKDAGEAFMKAGDCAVKDGTTYEVSTAYSEAGTCFRKAADLQRANICFDQCVQLNIEANRFGNAAKIEKERAEMYEEMLNLEAALKAYQKAYQYFTTDDNNKVQAASCASKIAHIHTELKDFPAAIRKFEELGASALASPLRSQAREQFFKALLVRIRCISHANMSEGIAEVREALDTYVIQDPSMRISQEAELVTSVLDELEASSADGIRQAAQRFSEYKSLDDWKISLLYHSLSLLEEDQDER